MKRLVGEFLLLLLACDYAVVSSSGSCSRTPPPHTDCFTANNECIYLYEKSDPSTPVSLLPYPPANTRTCYRTCFDESGTCKTFPSVVNNQLLGKDPETSQYSIQRIFSPRYGIRDYRKCTNCRYNIKCSEGQLLSYSVLEFDVERDSSCSGQQKCIDWVEIDYVNYGTAQRFCGVGEEGQIHVDGSSELMIEFVSNREQENVGFLYFAICSEPDFDQNAVKFGIEESESRMKRAAAQCTSPSRPRTSDDFIPQEVRKLLEHYPNAVQHTVSRTGFVTYSNNEITVRDKFKETYRGILSLFVKNRFNERTYRAWAKQRFSGFGYLIISGTKAYFYQLGAHPVFQPTEEETKLLFELERGINEELGEEGYYDVMDMLDIQESLTHPAYMYPVQRMYQQNTAGSLRTQRQIERHARIAMEYGNACNAVLRAAACAYQKLVMRRDCNTGQLLD